MGADTVVLTGSDIPDLSIDLIRDAFAELQRPVGTPKLPGVIGPAVGGGHYLIGLRAPGADLFENVAWSTETVLAGTKSRATDHNIELVHLLDLADIDILDGYRA